jgi:PAS domain-containing protein
VVRGQGRRVWMAAAAALLALLLAALAPGSVTSPGPGRWSWPAGLRLATYCAGAVGVVVLGVAYHRHTGVITSIAARLAAAPRPGVPNRGPHGLLEAVEAHLAEDDKTVRHLQEELRDLLVRAQLAERQKRHTEAILDSLRDAVLVVDGADRLLMANDAAARLFGFDAPSARHRPRDRRRSAR